MASTAKKQKTTTKRKTRLKEVKAKSKEVEKEESPLGELMKLIDFGELPAVAGNVDLLLTRPPMHKPSAGINPLVDAAAYIFSTMGQLARMRTCHQLPELHHKLVEEIQEFQEAVQDQDYRGEYLDEYIPVATYALCTTLDDIIRYTAWGGQGQWDDYLLLNRFQQEILTRENFLIILERFIQDQNIFIDMMEFIYICLNLGFNYSCHSSGFSAEQLQRIMHSLYKRIRVFRGNFYKFLSPHPLKMAQSVYFKPPKKSSRFKEYLQKLKSARMQQAQQPSGLAMMEQEHGFYHDVSQYLAKRFVTIKGQKLELSALPWVLFIGLPDSGKSTLIANSKVKFIVDQKPNYGAIKDYGQAYHWDWAVTTNSVFFDIPGAVSSQHPGWHRFMDLIMHDRGVTGVNGATLVISASDILDKAHHPMLITQLAGNIADLTNRFGADLPINLIISKCDLIPGFMEFFDDYTEDELAQPWGFRLFMDENNLSIFDVFNEKFDSLIKQLNNQLIYRLHQEKDFRHHEKFRIKNFPLEMEQLKDLTGEIILQILSQDIPMALKGIFFVSAMQNPDAEESNLPQIIPNEEFLQALTIMEAPKTMGQSCFIKQLLQGCLVSEENLDKNAQQSANKSWFNFLYKQL